MHSQGDSLSRSYIVKECRKELNRDVHSLILFDRETGKKSVLEPGTSGDRSSSVKLDLPKACAVYGAAAADNTAAHDRSRLDSAMKDHEPDASTRHFSSLSEKKNEVYSLLYMLDKFKHIRCW